MRFSAEYGEGMIACIRCGGFLSHDSSNLSSMCAECVGVLLDSMTPERRAVMVEVGIDALIEEYLSR